MATTPDPSNKENTYFIHDSGAELARLVEQERFFQKALGGLLPEQPDLAAFLAPFHRVLDVASGSGGWVLEMARQYPHLEVIGFDIDARMIAYANTQAQVAGFDNASFRVMNAAEPLDFPDDYFDLVNARFMAVVGAAAWPHVTRELYRITRPGGIIRLTETEQYSVSNSPSFERLSAAFLEAERRAGLALTQGPTSGQTVMLGRFLRDAGCVNIQRRPQVIDWSAGTAEHEPMFQDLRMFIKLLQPFIIEVGVLTQEESDQLYREAEREMMSDDFCALLNFLTVWGEKPKR
jgi:SAM-dependent methyltransferase